MEWTVCRVPGVEWRVTSVEFRVEMLKLNLKHANHTHSFICDFMVSLCRKKKQHFSFSACLKNIISENNCVSFSTMILFLIYVFIVLFSDIMFYITFQNFRHYDVYDLFFSDMMFMTHLLLSILAQ